MSVILKRKIWRIGFQGELGAFSQIAAERFIRAMGICDGDFVLVPTPSFPRLFELLVAESIDFAAIAIENSVAGPVLINYRLLYRYSRLVRIMIETSVQIIHSLIAPPGVQLSDVKKVYSHEMALPQCDRFLSQHPDFEAIQWYDTAGAVKMIIEEGKKDSAAIAGAHCARRYGGEVLVENIGNDSVWNETRFFLLRLASLKFWQWPWPERKTSVLIAIANNIGTLVDAEIPFKNQKINLSTCVLCPLPRRTWQYVLCIDFPGDPRDKRVEIALQDVADHYCSKLICIGSYPVIPPPPGTVLLPTEEELKVLEMEGDGIL